LELLETGTTEQPDLLNLAHLTLPEHLKLLLLVLLEMVMAQLMLLLGYSCGVIRLSLLSLSWRSFWN
jgi:hypothetical protein